MHTMKMESQQSDREVLAGVVERVTYQNADNGFCVIRIKARGHRDLVTVVGHAAVISAGEWITAAGDWTNDRTHGQQFNPTIRRRGSQGFGRARKLRPRFNVTDESLIVRRGCEMLPGGYIGLASPKEGGAAQISASLFPIHLPRVRRASLAATLRNHTPQYRRHDVRQTRNESGRARHEH